MELAVCQVSNCVAIGVFSCTCTSPLTTLCALHLGEHFLTGDALSHNSKRVYVELSEEAQENFKTAQQVTDLYKRDLKEQAFALITQQMQDLSLKAKLLLTEITTRFKSFEANIATGIKYKLVPEENVDGWTENALKGDFCFNLTINDDLELVQDEYIDLETSEESKLEMCEDFEEESKLEICEDFEEESSQFMYYFIKNTKILRIVDLENNSYTEKSIDSLPETMGLCAAICPVDQDTIFIYGGEAQALKSTCFLINHSTGAHEKLPDLAPARWDITATKVNNDIYVFGGYSDSFLTTSSRFSLRDRKWYDIQPFPEPAYDIACLKLGNKLLVTGREAEWIYLYYTDSDMYEEVAAVCNGMKLFISGENEIIYLLDDSKVVFLSTPENLTSWEPVGSFNSSLSNLVYPVQKFGNSHYFIIWKDITCYKFNESDISLEEIQLTLNE